ncbi:MAG: glycosyl hydrolase [Pirellulales bacterium]
MTARVPLPCLVAFLSMLTSPVAVAEEGVTQLGAGSYAASLPPGAKGPPETIFRTENAAGPMPTNDWWSSLAWMPFSERHYPHPLAMRAEAAGLRVYYPGNRITATRDAIFGFMPAGGSDDLVLGHSAESKFPDARVDGFSDWFVSVRFGDGRRGFRVSYGHGSPFVYALYSGGQPQVTFAKPPEIWSGGATSVILGVTVNGKHYGLFGPSGSTWTGIGSKTLTNQSADRPYFSLALLPDKSDATLALFHRYAYAHVTDTRVSWRFDSQTSEVRTTFAFTTKAYEGTEGGTLFALYPHQWRNAEPLRFSGQYGSVRGVMKLAAGTSFATRMRFPGVLPALPNVGGCDRARLAGYLKAEIAAPVPPVRDTYAEGKSLGKLASLAPIAEQAGLADVASALDDRLRQRLESWFTATDDKGQAKTRGLFCYDRLWGTLIGYPASFGSDAELNDHHFHYGYFIKAAAEVARAGARAGKPAEAWAADGRWGGMVKLLVLDVACADRNDRQFPFLRNFDPYAGHSWASGHARFGDGNNNESSSEAMNAWTGIILFGEAAGDKALRDLGIYLYTTELAAIEEYWFDVHDENHPADYTPSVVTMIWGGKGANGTWFSGNPEAVHGINWLPIHGGSLYLGRNPAYVEKNCRALVAENKGTDWDSWADIIWMYRALASPREALDAFEAAGDRYPAEGGNSRANTYFWLATLQALGQVDPTVSADDPLYAVFRKGDQRTYAVYSMRNQPRTVTFSDGFRLEVKGSGFVMGKASGDRPGGRRRSP